MGDYLIVGVHSDGLYCFIILLDKNSKGLSRLCWYASVINDQPVHSIVF